MGALAIAFSAMAVASIAQLFTTLAMYAVLSRHHEAPFFPGPGLVNLASFASLSRLVQWGENVLGALALSLLSSESENPAAYTSRRNKSPVGDRRHRRLSVFRLMLRTVLLSSIWRPMGTPLVLWNLRVTNELTKFICMVAILVIPPLLLLAPLFTAWLMVRQLAVQPYKTLCQCFRMVIWIISGLLMYSLAPEILAPLRPGATLGRDRIWIAYASKWAAPIAYAAAVMWTLTDCVGIYLISRAAVIHSIWIPRPPWWRTIDMASFLVLPAATFCYAYVQIAVPLALTAELTSQAILIIALITLGVALVVLFDVLVYWAAVSFLRPIETSSSGAQSSLDAIAVVFFLYTVSDLDVDDILRGGTRWSEDTNRHAGILWMADSPWNTRSICTVHHVEPERCSLS